MPRSTSEEQIDAIVEARRAARQANKERKAREKALATITKQYESATDPDEMVKLGLQIVALRSKLGLPSLVAAHISQPTIKKRIAPVKHDRHEVDSQKITKQSKSKKESTTMATSTKPIVSSYASKKDVSQADATDMLIMSGYKRKAALAKYSGNPYPAASTASAACKAHAKRLSISETEARAALIETGKKRLDALSRFAKRPKSESGRVKGARKTKGGNKAGWNKGKRREQ